MDQSFHMTDLCVKGPDAIRLISDLSVNSFANFGRNKAKQMVCVNHDGFVIGDAIVFGLEEDEVNIVGRPVLPNWVEFHAETGGYNVTVERDQRSLDDPDKPRKTYRCMFGSNFPVDSLHSDCATLFNSVFHDTAAIFYSVP